MIIQTINKGGHVLATSKHLSDRVCIGRGYSNHFIVSDAYVDDQHIEVKYDPELHVFTINDLNSTNGCFVERGKKRLAIDKADFQLEPTDIIHIGKTRLRCIDEQTQVAPAIKFSKYEPLYSQLSSWKLMIVLLFCMLALRSLNVYLENPFNEKLSKDLMQGVFIALIGFAYAGIWSIIARAQHLDIRYFLHTNLCLIGLTSFIFIEFSQWFLLFNLDGLWLDGYMKHVFGMMIITWVMYISCYHAMRLSVKGRWIFATILPGLLLLSDVMAVLGKNDFNAYPSYQIMVISPDWQWRPTTDEADFLKQAQTLQADVN